MTNMRIVYDASTKFTGPALNNCLHAGPLLLSEVPNVLACFRYHLVVLVAGIEKALLMVQIKEADRNVFHFVRVDDTDSENPNIVVKCFNGVVFGVASSPFLLNATIRHHMTKYEANDPQFMSNFLTSLYVDDLNGGKTVSLKHLGSTKKERSRITEAGFNLS